MVLKLRCAASAGTSRRPRARMAGANPQHHGDLARDHDHSRGVQVFDRLTHVGETNCSRPIHHHPRWRPLAVLRRRREVDPRVDARAQLRRDRQDSGVG